MEFYHVLAIDKDDSLQYLGRTADLALKTDTDKTIDLDDGTTYVGSEKLTLSCTMLGSVINQYALKQVILVQDYPFVLNSGRVQIPVRRINLKEQEHYSLENVSGDFEKVKLEINMRYPVSYQASIIDEDWLYDNQLVLIRVDGQTLGYYEVTNGGKDRWLTQDPGNEIVEGCFAICFPIDSLSDIFLYNESGTLLLGWSDADGGIVMWRE